MPWCEGCDRFLNPNTLRADGTCPSCHREVAEPPPPATVLEAGPPDQAGAEGVERVEVAEVEVNLVPDLPPEATEVVKAPWHFKLLMVATVIYLVWRFGDMFGLLG